MFYLGAKGQVPTKINDSTGDDLFNLMLGQNASEKQMHSNSQSNEICDMSSLKLSLDEEEENKAESLVVEETFLTASSDRNSKNEPSVKFPVENPDKKDGKIKIGSFKSGKRFYKITEYKDLLWLKNKWFVFYIFLILYLWCKWAVRLQPVYSFFSWQAIYLKNSRTQLS